MIEEKMKELLEIRDDDELLKELENVLIFYSEKSYKNKYIKRFIPDSGKVYGVPLPILRKIASELGKFGKENPEKVISILKSIWKKGSFEERIVVAKTLERMKNIDHAISLSLISGFLDDISDWAICDNLACFSLRPIITGYPEEVLPLCLEWVRSEKKWIRRFGVVSLYSLAHEKKRRTSKEELEVIDVLMREEDRDVRRGVSWILREFSKKNQDVVFEFLLRYSKEKNRNTRWIVRNSIAKLEDRKRKQILDSLL
ncbi:MAG: DNA alkylation repair protein [Candidatus Methanofastidiosia archaeon]